MTLQKTILILINLLCVQTVCYSQYRLTDGLLVVDEQDNLANGKITMYHNNGTFKFEGTVRDGLIDGQGTYVWLNGNRYVGEWKDGKRNGQGTYTWADGRKYVGNFIENKRTGQGTLTFPSGNKYIGNFIDGKRTGQGTYIWTNGDKYVGEFYDGKLDGQGTFTSNGDKYVGEWKDGKRNGQGTYTWADGRKYVGNFIENKRTGQGTYIWTNGDKYVGEWKDGKRNGQGTYTWASGDRYVGEWREDMRTGQGEYYHSNGDFYTGTFINGKRQGFGKMVFANGSIYIGDFKDSKICGQGILYYSDEVYYIGDFQDYQRNGEGILYLADGRTLEGVWRNNNFVEEKHIENTDVSTVNNNEMPSTSNDTGLGNTTGASTPVTSANYASPYAGYNILPVNQMMYMNPMDVTNYCNQFPGGINVLLDPRFAMMQVQQQMQAQQAVANQQREQLQKVWNNMLVVSAQRAEEERENFISMYNSLHPGASASDALDAYGNYVNGLSQSRNEAFQEYQTQRSKSSATDNKNRSRVEKIGEKIVYTTTFGLGEKTYCDKCKSEMFPHTHEPINIVVH